MKTAEVKVSHLSITQDLILLKQLLLIIICLYRWVLFNSILYLCFKNNLLCSYVRASSETVPV
jgi:hypothetical protein